MTNVTLQVKDCFGCGVCVATCSHKCLSLELNRYGFYHPVIKERKMCINCGQCINVCSFLNEGLADESKVIESAAVWSNHTKIRESSSSGGTALELCRTALNQGYHICGVKYNVHEHRAEHCICTSEEQLTALQGSKYIQSYTADAFPELRKKQKYLVIGSPCQIDSLRRLIKTWKREDDFILVDFFCHGVPSYLLWEKYIKTYGLERADIQFRSKHNYRDNSTIPWNRFVLTGIEPDGTVKQPFLDNPDSDWFYYFFLEDFCLGRQCYKNCKFKMLKSSADIRIGDVWADYFTSIPEGTSAVLVYSSKAASLLSSTSAITTVSMSIESLCQGQMAENPPLPRFYKSRLKLMQSSLCFSHIKRGFSYLEKWQRRLIKLYEKIRRNNNHA